MSGSWTAGVTVVVVVATAGFLLAIVRAEIATLRERVDGLSNQFDAKFDGLRNEMVARFDGLERELRLLHGPEPAREQEPAA